MLGINIVMGDDRIPEGVDVVPARGIEAPPRVPEIPHVHVDGVDIGQMDQRSTIKGILIPPSAVWGGRGGWGKKSPPSYSSVRGGRGAK